MTNHINMIGERCMNDVRENVGTVELEQFIYYIRSQSFDYTKWQREHYDAMTPEEIFNALQNYSEKHTFNGKKAVII